MKPKILLIIISFLLLISSSTSVFSQPNATITNPTESATYTTSDVDLNWTIDDTPDWCAYILDDNLTDIEYCARKINYLDVITGAGSPNYLQDPRSLFVVDDIAYITSIDDNTFTTFDISDPLNIIHLGNISGIGSPNYLWGATSVYVVDDIAYVASRKDNALTIFNVSDPSNIVHISAITGAGSPNYLNYSKSVYVVDDVAYVLTWLDNALSTFNVSDPSNIIHLGVVNGSPNYFDNPKDLFVVDNIAYMVSSDDVFTTFNVSNPSNMVYLGNISGVGSPNYLGGANQIKVIDNIAYVASIGDDSLTIFDVSDPVNIIHLDAITGSGSYGDAPYYLFEAKSVYVENNIAYVTAEDSLTIFDVSNTSNIVHLSAISGVGSPYFLGDAWDVSVNDDIVYVISKSGNSLVTYKFNIQESTTLTGLSDGTHNIKITANDSSGNIGNSSLVTFSVDTTVPQFSNQVKNTTPYINDYVEMNITITDLYPDSYKFFWNTTGTFVNDSPSIYTSGETVSTSKQITTAHQNICWGYWANDTLGNLNTSSLDCFTVQNSLPIQGTPIVSSSPTNSNTTNETLYCYNNTQSDLDGDVLTRTFLWYKNDIETAETSQSVSSSSTSKTEQWKCEVSLYDGYDYNRKNSTTLTILNSPPYINATVPNINADTDVAWSDDSINCTDVDGDTITYYVNDTVLSVNSATGELSDTPTEAEVGIHSILASCDDGTINDTQIFTYTVNDITTPTWSNLQNNASTVTKINGYVNWSVNLIDGVGLSSYIFSYNNSGTFVVDSPVEVSGTSISVSIIKQVTVPHSYICGNFTFNDTNNNWNTTDLSCMTVQNSLPEIGTPTLNDSVPKTNDVLLCQNGSYSDVDNDGLSSWYYRWYENDVLIGGQTSSTLDLTLTGLDKDDVILCEIRANDGIDYSEYKNSSIATIQNTLPTTPTVTSPSDGNNYTSVDIEYSSPADIDGDIITYYSYIDDVLNQTSQNNITNWEASDGTYTLKVSAYDGYDFSDNSTPISFTLDTTGPSVNYEEPTPADSSRQLTNSVIINISYSNGVGVDTCLLEWNSVNETFDNFDADNYWETKSTTDGVTYTFNVYCNDTLGNLGNSGVRSFVENTKPTVPSIIYPQDNYNYTSVTHIDYASSDAEGDTTTYYTYVDDVLNETLTTNITLINFADGTYKLDISAYDSYEFSVNSTIYFTVDSVGPIIHLSNATAIYMQSVFNITANVSDDLGINQVLVEVEEPSTTKTNYTMTLLNDDIYNYTYSADESGTHNYLIYAFDKLNNVNFGGAGAFETVYDVSIPQFSNQVINATPYLNDYVEMNITIIDDNPDSYIFFWNVTGSFVNDTPSTYTSGVAVSTVKQTTTAHQTICYGYYANDTLGNDDTSSLSCFTVANSIPTTPTVTSPSDGNNYTSVDIEYSSSDIDGDIITYYLYIDDVLNQTSQNNITNWEASDGTYTLKVSAYDGYDFSDNSTPISFTLDTTGPIITVLSPVDYETYNKVPVWINFTTNENSLCSVNNSYWNLNTSTLTSFSFSNDNSTPNDFYSILISCNDSLLNVGTKNIYFTLDTDAPVIHSITPAEDNSTSIYIMQLPSEQFTLNVTVDDNILVYTYNANITKKSDSTLMWDYVNTSVNLVTFNFIETLDVGSWENTTYIYDNEVCNGISCVREVYEFTFEYPYPPVITVYSPTPADVDGGIGETISFDIEVEDNNIGDIITYDWQVNFVGVSTDEDYDYLIETGHIGLVYNVLVTATDDSPLTLSDTESWNVTIISGHYTDYDTRDFSKIVIDGIGTAGAAVVDWTDVLIILAILSIIITASVVYFKKFKYKY